MGKWFKKKQEDGPPEPPQPPKVSYGQLFRYASPWDKFLIFSGAISSIANGVALPLMTVFFGDILSALLTYNGTDASRKYIDEQVTKGCLYITLIGAGSLVVSYICMVCWMTSGENQTLVVLINVAYPNQIL